MSSSSVSESSVFSAFNRCFPESFALGCPALSGNTEYDFKTDEYRLTGAGANMWFGADEAQFAGRRVSGDVTLSAQAEWVSVGGHAHRKFGIGLRDGCGGDAPHVSVAVHADGLTSLQFRRVAGGKTEELVSPLRGATVMHLERRGKDYVMLVARVGEPFVKTVLVNGPELPEETWAGIFVCSHEATVLEEARFWNVRVGGVKGTV